MVQWKKSNSEDDNDNEDRAKGGGGAGGGGGGADASKKETAAAETGIEGVGEGEGGEGKNEDNDDDNGDKNDSERTAEVRHHNDRRHPPPADVSSSTATAAVTNTAATPNKPSILRVPKYLRSIRKSSTVDSSSGGNSNSNNNDTSHHSKNSSNKNSDDNDDYAADSPPGVPKTPPPRRKPSFTASVVKRAVQHQPQILIPKGGGKRQKRDEKVVGLKNSVLSASTRNQRRCLIPENTTAGAVGDDDNDIAVNHSASRDFVGVDCADNHDDPAAFEFEPGCAPATAAAVDAAKLNQQQQQAAGTGSGTDTVKPYSIGQAGVAAAKAKKKGIKERQSVEELEEEARKYVTVNPLWLLWVGNIAALKVFGIYLIKLETIISCLLTAGLTCFFYFQFEEEAKNGQWNGGGMDFVLLAFAVTAPIRYALFCCSYYSSRTR